MTDPAPSARTPQSQKPNETVRSLAQFKKVATALGATVTEFPRKPAKYAVKKFGILYSPASGGCGSSGCGCSPGLWVSAFQ